MSGFFTAPFQNILSVRNLRPFLLVHSLISFLGNNISGSFISLFCLLLEQAPSQEEIYDLLHDAPFHDILLR